ncbi:uncharacterized protein M437DRAFT_52069 [Aureobasidium melanogenum CBS 110374]|uniref:Uncharacterized protein n=1 Tax=Aureobasidium melanogenum (strain CBS 110374) TaxID=1043003 RepID=A0A074WFL8_AURM1|nr:uncharacterized protein M437DRAFT_52069 [Aureobasidium melanogenum CBS 110374]KEQ61286.1 hypothetical protein M437DRAFT_52069 [Aureobasidium melanogenum CBS 110374]
MLKAANGAITKEFYAKMQAKPDILRVFLAQRRAAQKQKYQTVTKFRTARIRIAKDWYQAHKQDDSYRRRCNMYLWCFHPTFRRPWIDHLPWPTHRPLAYRQKVAHCCAECGTRHSGLKSWWQSVKDPDSFLCHKHYTDRGWSECMPKGYEHVRTFKGLNARYKELNQE